MKTHLSPPTLFDSRQYGFSQVIAARVGATAYIAAIAQLPTSDLQPRES